MLYNKMKYSIADLLQGISKLADQTGPVTIMEVCGTHTSSIQQYGLPSLLPQTIRLVSGPGCPVCVTSSADIAAAIALANRDDVIFTCFGDMMRVPCGKISLYSLYEQGRDIRLVTSPMDALAIAQAHPEKQVVYFGIGFETTAPHTAVLIQKTTALGIQNLSVLNTHKTMPQAIMALLQQDSSIDALLCPGHVAAMIGADAFAFVPEKLHLPAAIAGFEAYEILAAILRIMDLIHKHELSCINMYPQVVTKTGNRSALDLLYRVMEPSDAVWRGLGILPQSGLKFRTAYSGYEARNRFAIENIEMAEPKGCLCSAILRGKAVPLNCPHFGSDCTPDYPVGPCMVSSEGACAAYYRYREA
ncbi:MAG TPA: hydrogenase formation protein HypD [Bacillota bacterium]|nr:hydrogenase formation protein HypD [Bacillota bacterium]